MIPCCANVCAKRQRRLDQVDQVIAGFVDFFFKMILYIFVMACQVDFGVTEDVDVADGSHLFKLLDDGDGNLTHEEQLGLKGFGMISRSSEGGIRPLV